MDTLPEHPPVVPTLTSHMIGLCFSFLSYGVMLCQGLQYYQRYWKHDNWVLKAAVVGILLGETAHSGLYVHIAYYYLAIHHGHPDTTSHGVVSLTLVTPIVTFCIVVCEFIYVRRAYLILPLKFRMPFVISVVTLVTVSIASAWAFTGKLFLDSSFAGFIKFRWLLSVAFAVCAFLDVFIATVLSIALWKSRTGIGRTDALLRTLILYAFTTGTSTSIASIACLMVDLIEGHHVYIISFALVTAKVYANITLLTLNLRRSLSTKLSDTPLDTEWVDMSGLRTV
ncbi:hypothetical protein C8Q74DRAFT_83374 [Fomes fomentarius]|nr:hypothetical protein C8Q74DRAFT_83374 [Fomes fomentarius]